jgi:bifunctional DNA-binding transcriptional regulator/antitoxin component of YhaV-PrlF toxin-antitoxin module
MELVKVRKAGDEPTIPLPAELIEALHLTEDDVLAVQHVGEEIILRRAAPASETPQHPEGRMLSAFPGLSFCLQQHRTAYRKASGADAFQVKSVSDARFVTKLGNLTDEEMDNLARAIALCVGYR